MTVCCGISETSHNTLNISCLVLYGGGTDTQCFTECRRFFQLSYIAKPCALACGFAAFGPLTELVEVEDSRIQGFKDSHSQKSKSQIV